MANYVHTVYFALNDHSKEALENFIALCRRCLPGHPGEITFILGPRNLGINRDVSDLHFDVAMTIVFTTLADYHNYDRSDRHNQFREELTRVAVSVRVFDSITSA